MRFDCPDCPGLLGIEVVIGGLIFFLLPEGFHKMSD